MTNRIDEIFSLARLRRQWQVGPKADTAEDKVKLSRPGPIDVYEELENLIQLRFQRGLNPGMELLLGELLECLVLRFPLHGATGEAVSEERAALDAAIRRTLDRIEDLFEALEMRDADLK